MRQHLRLAWNDLRLPAGGGLFHPQAVLIALVLDIGDVSAVAGHGAIRRLAAFRDFRDAGLRQVQEQTWSVHRHPARAERHRQQGDDAGHDEAAADEFRTAAPCCRRRGRGARRDLGRGRVVSDRRDACRKPVSVTRNRDDMPRLLRALSQGLAEQKDLLRQVAFFNHDIGPDRPEQFVFRDDAVAVRDEEDERIERFRRQRDGCAVAEEEAHLRQHVESFERPVRAGSEFGHDLPQILPPSGTLSVRVRRIEGVREVHLRIS